MLRALVTLWLDIRHNRKAVNPPKRSMLRGPGTGLHLLALLAQAIARFSHMMMLMMGRATQYSLSSQK